MTQHGIVVVSSHDDQWLTDLTNRALVVDGLDLSVFWLSSGGVLRHLATLRG
jgi:hypothetical protein